MRERVFDGLGEAIERYLLALQRLEPQGHRGFAAGVTGPLGHHASMRWASMRWLPPWRMAERERWALENPRIAGLYVGTAFSGTFGVWALVAEEHWREPESWLAAAVFIVVVGSLVGLLFARQLRKYGHRPDAESHPEPTMRNPWSRASTLAVPNQVR